MPNYNSVGSNAGKGALPQCCTPFQQDLFAPVGGGPLVYTPADVLALLIAQGATHNDLAQTPFAATDFIHSVDVDLKPETGEGQIWDGAAFVTEEATTCDAVVVVNGGETNVDPTGSRENTGKTVNSYNFPTQLTEVRVEEGSIITVTGVVCQDVPGVTSAAAKKV